MVDLGTLGGPMSDARDISDLGVIVGAGHTPERHTLAFLDQGAGLVDIGSLPGFANSYAIKVNRSLQVAGTAAPEGSGGRWGAPRVGGRAHAFLWDNGTITDLGLLRGSTSCRAFSLNNHGQVVGTCGFTEHHIDSHAFLWTSGVLTDLQMEAPSDSGWLLEEARGINDRGWIVGTGKHTGESRGYVLIPSTKG
jgi:probable HAF family extracellular repeat protein